MSVHEIVLGLLQLPFEGTPWLDMMSDVLNVFLAFAIRGYLILILVGLMIYVTGLSDGLAKSLVVGGVILYFIGPFIFELAAGVIGVPPPTIQQATLTWLDMFGMTDAEMVGFIVAIGDIVLATCVLIGAILYFTPSSKDLAARGQSLIVRGLILAPMLLFFHVAPWI